MFNAIFDQFPSPAGKNGKSLMLHWPFAATSIRIVHPREQMKHYTAENQVVKYSHQHILFKARQNLLIVQVVAGNPSLLVGNSAPPQPKQAKSAMECLKAAYES
jgi:hypothetical protein